MRLLLNNVNGECGNAELLMHCTQEESQLGETSIVQLLLDKGADINALGVLWDLHYVPGRRTPSNDLKRSNYMSFPLSDMKCSDRRVTDISGEEQERDTAKFVCFGEGQSLPRCVSVSRRAGESGG